MRIAVAGATGRTGRLIVERALARGHVVRALARGRIPDVHEGSITWVTGSAEEPTSLKWLIDDSEVVISAVGPRPDNPKACSLSTSNLIAAGAPRLLLISGMGVTLPGDQKSIIDKAMSAVVKRMAPQAFADKELELAILHQSSIPWTAVRIGALSDDREVSPVKADPHRPPGFAINTGSLAAFCVAEAEAPRFPRQAPFVAF